MEPSVVLLVLLGWRAPADVVGWRVDVGWLAFLVLGALAPLNDDGAPRSRCVPPRKAHARADDAGHNYHAS